MRPLRAVSIGIIIWIIGVSIYNMSFYISFLENATQQANTLLFIAVIPLVWFGTKLYYKKGSNTNGYWVGQTFFLTSAILDALITVPLFIMPSGGSHYQFFTDLGFWIIGFEFLAVATLYWFIKINSKTDPRIKK